MENDNLKTQNSERLLNNNKVQNAKTKKRHSSALSAALLGRSAVGHARSRTITNKPGDFAHSGTNISYED